ncbi:hypothetical protein V500_03637 [Pseudogymnoascus sp. VKM F-4518 (FW-2643)]|nr:hypothetical protein V500_03637 [Pseudogymnoascus sp. VKM F-4518 (FW-2643)]
MADAAANREYTDALQLRNRQLQAENDGLRAENGGLRAEILRLNEQIEIGIEKYGPNCFVRRPRQVDWRKGLRESGYTRDPKKLKKIYKAACKQFNMSSVHQNHGLYYIPPNDDALEWEPAVADTDAAFQSGKFFNFSALLKDHPKIAFKIAAYTMVKHTAISVVARFDVHDVYPPTQGGLDRKSGLSYRFHWGGDACAINSSPLPRHVLAPIFVSRDWHEMFATAFYFMNSFSFEALGEFGIFCKNTPRARWQRMPDMAITWIGSIMETSNPKKSGPRWDMSRWGMHRLGQFLNLRSLVISLDETSNGRIRRKDEPENMKKPLERSTRNHDNYRMTRDLRKLRGMDNIYQLRGIEHIEVYDNYQEFPQAPVRDQTFVQDLTNQVCSPKSREDEVKAKPKNLAPLLRRKNGTPKYKPSRQVKQVLKYIFNSRPRNAGPERPQEMAGDDSDWDSDDNDDDLDDDQNPADFSDSESDDVDYDQLDNHQNPRDDADSDDDEDDDDAPDQGANALRAAPAASRARNVANGGGEPDGDEDKDIEMDKLDPNQGRKLGDDSDDDGFEFIHSAKLSPIKIEDDDELTFIGSVKHPTQTIDLSNLPDMEDPDTVFPSIEEGHQKEEVKSEDLAGAEGMESIPVFEEEIGPQRESLSAFGPLSPRRGQTEQSSLFVRQSPSSRHSFSSHVFGFFGRPSWERKRPIEDEEEGEDIDPRPSLRRRLSHMTMDEDETE